MPEPEILTNLQNRLNSFEAQIQELAKKPGPKDHSGEIDAIKAQMSEISSQISKLVKPPKIEPISPNPAPISPNSPNFIDEFDVLDPTKC